MGLMKKIATEMQMGNPPPVTIVDQLPARPAHCTRRRLKPGIDGCGCEFCEAIDGPWMNAEPPDSGGNPPSTVSSEEIARI